MLTRLQIATTVQSNLNDATGVFFDLGIVNDSIQDAYDEIVVDTQCIENTTNISFTAGTLYYDLYNGIGVDNALPNFWRITKLFNLLTNRWIPCVDSRVLDKFRFDWESASGTPWFAYIVNFQYLGFFPHQPSSIGSFDVLHKTGRDLLTSDDQVLQIPDEFVRVIELYATADMLECYQEFTKAKVYWDDYEIMKQKLMDYVPSRSLPDEFLQLNDLDFPAFRGV